MDSEGPVVKILKGSGVSTLHSDQSCPGTLVRLGSKTGTDPAGDRAWGKKRKMKSCIGKQTGNKITTFFNRFDPVIVSKEQLATWGVY